MKIYLLKPFKNVVEWTPWYDKCFGFILFAKNEKDARRIADEAACDENNRSTHPWLNIKKTSCIELSDIKEKDGPIIMSDIRSA